MFEKLETIFSRPEPWEVMTTSDLWTDEHTSKQMLEYHLNGDVDMSSRRTEFIDRSTEWIIKKFQVGSGKRVVDFGCGPGLYTQRLAKTGAQVIGIDFSRRSIEYARSKAEAHGLDVQYICGDYLNVGVLEPADMITMIFCDYCALGPTQRKQILDIFKRGLKAEGRILFDVFSQSAFERREEANVCEKNQLFGFWTPHDYYGFMSTFKYPERHVAVDKYTIVEPDRTRTVYNWLQYFTPESLSNEIEAAGLNVCEVIGDVAGREYDPAHDEFAVIVSR
jgi:SAM-dependent methyltransferase